MNPHLIKYPRNAFMRFVYKALSRIALGLLTKPKVIGRENFPKSGPVILAGNHVGLMEVVMLIAYAPYNVELVGTGDIPIEPKFAKLADSYKFIAINRGNLDRQAIYAAVGVLKQNGVLGVFPEGGIWEPGAMRSRGGVALLSMMGGAPVVPIGFSGMRLALKEALNFKFPRLVMRIGEAIPAISESESLAGRKEMMESQTELIMQKIQELLPPEEKHREPDRLGEQHSLEISLLDTNSQVQPLPDDMRLSDCRSLAKFLNQPIFIDILENNLKYSVGGLKNLANDKNPVEVKAAVETIFEYLEINPGFITYRLGMDDGLQVQQCLVQLKQLTEYACDHQMHLKFDLAYSYVDSASGQLVTVKDGRHLVKPF